MGDEIYKADYYISALPFERASSWILQRRVSNIRPLPASISGLTSLLPIFRMRLYSTALSNGCSIRMVVVTCNSWLVHRGRW